MSPAARVIAFYLPQFHPVPENDDWWGKGFTEWTNVGKAKPLFRGHYQPRVPADLGYYDLRLPEVREAQADLARSAGIEGFMYWHYWFGNGRRILERPFNDVLASGKPDFPFSLGWANHSWTNRSWHSSSQWKPEGTILEQAYPGELDVVEHFRAVLPAFQDNRYIKVDDKPLFYIYAPFAHPSIRMFIDCWQNLAIQNGFPGIHFVGCVSGWPTQIKEVLNFGFDAVNYNGQWNAEAAIKGRIRKLVKYKLIEKFGGVILDKYDFAKITKYLYSDIDRDDKVYPTIIPQWDRSPRSGRRATIYLNSTPEIFQAQVANAVSIVQSKKNQHRIIFLKSWNEWGEGNYVEPDLRYGHGYLDAIRASL
jgi:hypothetical protein